MSESWLHFRPVEKLQSVQLNVSAIYVSSIRKIVTSPERAIYSRIINFKQRSAVDIYLTVNRGEYDKYPKC